MKYRSAFFKTILVLLFCAQWVAAIPEPALAYSLTKERPVFLAWPLPGYIGRARISQLPNTPWTWHYLGLNPGEQCPPAFGYVTDLNFFHVWRDASILLERDAAQADPNDFQMVNCYSTPGQAGENGHEATDIKAPAGTPVLASADGKIADWRLNGLNSMVVLKHCLHGKWNADGICLGGETWYTTYMHITPADEILQMEKDIAEGDVVGAIYEQGDNSHLHFEVGLEKRSYSNYVNPWGRDESPWVGCMWKDQSFCVQPNPGYEALLMLTETGRLLVRREGTKTIELFDVKDMSRIQMTGQRMAVLDANGTLFVRDGEFGHGVPFDHDFFMNWVLVSEDVAEFQITEDRIAVLTQDGGFKVQQDRPGAAWGLVIDDVSSFSMSAHRVGVLLKDGNLLVKEGGLDATWTVVGMNVQAFQLVDSRIAVIDLKNNLFVKEGMLDPNTEWKPMAENVRAAQVTGTRVAYLDMDGNLFVNDGNLRAEWVLQSEDVERFQLAGNRILVLGGDGIWKLRNDDLYQPWENAVDSPVQFLQMNGDLPIVLDVVE